MSKQCDNKSVGIIIKNDGKFALIKRKNYPISYAFVAGHLDGDTFVVAAKKETEEEAGLIVEALEFKLDEKFQNSCKREGGSEHHWQIFEATKWSGTLQAGSDAKEAHWVTTEKLCALAGRTRYFSEKLGISLYDLAQFTPQVVKDEEWQKDPGLEPVWVVMLEKIGIV